MPTLPNRETSQTVSRNLFDDSQTSNRNTEKSSKWELREDLALASTWLHVTNNPIVGKNQRKTSMWAKIMKIYDEARAENPNEIAPRNENQMKGRFKRLGENASKWVAAYKEAERRKTSGMSLKDIEINAHKIYEANGSKFYDLIVFNEVLCRFDKWKIHARDKTRSHPEDGESHEESGGSTKRSRTSEEGEYVVHANQETPNSSGSTIQRIIGRDAAKKKGKGKGSQSSSYQNNEFVEELRQLRLTRQCEIEVMNKRLDFDKKREEREIKREEMELKREERKTRQTYLVHLNGLLAKDYLSPEEEDMKRNLLEWLNGK